VPPKIKTIKIHLSLDGFPVVTGLTLSFHVWRKATSGTVLRKWAFLVCSAGLSR
jgi:hypothetical protein